MKFSEDLNIPANKLLYFFLVFCSLIILVAIFIAPILALYKFGPDFVKSRVDFQYKYSYLPAQVKGWQMSVLIFVFYLIPVFVIFSTLMMKITLYLRNKIVWTRPYEFLLYPKFYRSLKFLLLPFIALLLFGLYLQLDTYLLIGDSVILYNGPFTLQPRNYELNEIKKIVSYKYPKDGSIGYFLVFKDGTTVVIDDKGAVFVSERSGLPIIETQDFDY